MRVWTRTRLLSFSHSTSACMIDHQSFGIIYVFHKAEFHPVMVDSEPNAATSAVVVADTC
ncbi:hypothetical protein BS50DRAFT_569904 [Corynespora cassiicola Philippines]|uniref:Uncharacterized protein n=1 Tax=Corynespora cassiicola Philippines TaxID=1448308 RepID=A0A2T2P435_CORCC|nr:hypothetical protein BS50DRAFT_569904 [Corynespora cassiicola Philippines]